MRALITGATGFVGGHIAEGCAERDWQVVAVTRATSDTSILDKVGATIHQGDLGDPATLRRALEGVGVVIHCAAKVGNWGPLPEYRKINVEALRVLLNECKKRSLTRFVHMSSLGVYPPRHHYGSDEGTPLPARHRDSYTQTKVESEQLALAYHRDFGVPVVVLRPGFVYGPRDHAVLPKIINGLRQRIVRYPGGGRTALNTIFVRNLVDAVFLAIDHVRAVGQVYNLTDGEFVSKRQFIGSIADALELPHPTLTPPLWACRALTRVCEGFAKMRGATEAPKFNYASLKFLGLNLDFSIEKARRELGYRPRFTFAEGMAETMAWYKQTQPEGAHV